MFLHEDERIGWGIKILQSAVGGEGPTPVCLSDSHMSINGIGTNPVAPTGDTLFRVYKPVSWATEYRCLIPDVASEMNQNRGVICEARI
jgi:hypothetical protein